VLHKHNVPPAVAADLVALDLERKKAEVAAFQQEEAAHMEAQREALRKEFGAELPQKLQLAARAAGMLGLPTDHYALADAQVVAALVRVAALTGEDKLAPKAEAQGADIAGRVKELMASEAYKKNDPAVRAEVLRLNIELAKREGVEG